MFVIVPNDDGPFTRIVVGYCVGELAVFVAQHSSSMSMYQFDPDVNGFPQRDAAEVARAQDWINRFSEAQSREQSGD